MKNTIKRWVRSASFVLVAAAAQPAFSSAEVIDHTGDTTLSVALDLTENTQINSYNGIVEYTPTWGNIHGYNLTLGGNGNIAFSGNLSGTGTVATTGSVGVHFRAPLNTSGAVIVGGGGQVRFGGGISSASALTLGGSGSALFEGAVNLTGDIVASGSGTAVFTKIVNAARFIQSGSGTTEFAGSANAYISDFDVLNGTVVFNQAAGAIVQGADITVSGSGKLVFQNNDFQTPSWGTLSLGDGGLIALNGTSQYFGNLHVSGEAYIDFGFTEFSALHVGSISFAPDAILYIRNYKEGDVLGSNINPVIYSNIQLIPPAPVPEPSTYWLIIAGLLGLTLLLKRGRTTRP